MQSAWTWLLTPLSGASTHVIAPWVAWHARAMVLAWTILLPSGALIARFLKVAPIPAWPDELDCKTWWRLHLWLQNAGVAVMVAGLFLALPWSDAAAGAAAGHRLLGWTAILLAAVQLLGGLLRGTKGGPTGATLRGDHYDMTRRRRHFERVHKSLGWLCLPVAAAATALGLAIVDAPRWMPIAIGTWWLAYAALFAALQRAGWCVDTYQAIWGPSPSHPGNARRPIGLGIRRLSPSGKDRASRRQPLDGG